MRKNEAPNMSAQFPYTWNGMDVLFIVIGIFIIFFITAGLIFISVSVFSPESTLLDRQTTIKLSIGTALIESLAIVGSVYIFGIRRRKYKWSAAGIRPTSQRWIVISIALGLLAIPISSFVAIIVQYIFKLPIENPQISFLLPEDISVIGMLIMSILVGIVVPFAEELFFRGILYQLLRGRFGVWLGILGSSLLFGIVHGDIAVASAAFVLGLLLAVVFERSRSIWPCVLIHSINNGVKLLFLYSAFYLSGT
jgi:membrane protease YdiL (CAAX protease family)